jgi:uncharacterized protein YjiS (DUF1127 family)
MVMSDISTTYGHFTAIARPAETGGVYARIVAVVEKLRTFARIRRDLAILKSFDDRMLSDIGLSRGDVERAVRFGR